MSVSLHRNDNVHTYENDDQEGEMKKMRSRKGFFAGLAFLLMMLLCTGSVYAAEAAIEQVVIDKPSVRVDYRGVSEDAPDVFLKGEPLTVQNGPVKLADAGIAIEYYVLLDVSGSLSSTRFEDIKTSLQQFLTEMRENDRLVAYTFGDSVNKILTGEEDRESAAGVIASIQNGDMNTTLFEALNTAASEIDTISDDGMHRLIICISDGEDCADNTRDAETVAQSVSSKGIPVYTIGVEKKDETEGEARENRSHFSAVATQTGGVPWTVDQLQDGQNNVTENSVLNGLSVIRDTVYNTDHMELLASSNETSMQMEDLVLRFTDGTELRRNVLVSRHTADQEAPSVTDASVVRENELRVAYSEPVLGADNPSNYKLSSDHTIAVTQVIAEDTTQNSYSLILGENLVNGDYTLQIQNVTDHSEEKNPLQVYSEPQPFKIDVFEEMTEPMTEPKDLTAPTVTEIKPSEPDGFEITFSEKVAGAENNGNYFVSVGDKDVAVVQVKPMNEEGTKVKIVLGEKLVNDKYTIELKNITDASDQANALDGAAWAAEVQGVKEEKDIAGMILKWWPVVLTLVVVLLILLMIRSARKLKKNKVTLIEGVAVEKDNINRKVQVNIGDPKQAREVVIEINNGSDENKKIPYMIRGSLTVGRSKEDCDVFCNDSIMSRRHFQIIAGEDGNLYVEDLGSRNGTHVNGVLISERTILNPGDEIRAGKMHFKVNWKESEA